MELAAGVQDIDTSNTVNGKPIYYWVDQRDRQVPEDAGFVAVVNSTNITVQGLTLTNNWEGVLFVNTSNSRIEDVKVASNARGIVLLNSSNNTLANNAISNNGGCYYMGVLSYGNGILLSYSSGNTLTNNIISNNEGSYYWDYYGGGINLNNSGSNIIYRNNFINYNNIYNYSPLNVWKSPEEMTYTYNGSTYTNYLGNYWSDYSGSDADGDGIGETPYPIYSDADNYPLVEPFENYEIGDSFVDLGNPEDEARHNLVGWGAMQGPPENPYVAPSGDKTKRYQILRGDNSVDLWVKQIGIDYVLTAEVEDGGYTDNFEIYINGRGPIYSYTGKHLGNAAVAHQVLVPKGYITDPRVTVTFRNTATDDCGLAAVYNVGLTATTTPPTISSVSPQDGATDVKVDTKITATFSEAMDSSTITDSSFTLTGSSISGTVTYDPATYTATFTPDANLDYGHEYTATLSTAITDLAGNPLAAPYTWSFTTLSADVYWLAKAIMSEASVGTLEERIAVGWTVLNRLDSHDFGDDIEEIVKGGYAYNQEPTGAITALATDLLESQISDPTGGATYFFSPISMTGGYGPYEIPGTNKKSYIPSWAIPKGYSRESPPPLNWEMTGFYQTIENLEWVSGLENIRNWYFMFYRPIPYAGPVITSPLTIFASSPYYPYHVGDTLVSTFNITNRGGVPITFDILVVGGRVNNDVVDFDKAYGITLNAGEGYDYVGNLVPGKPGTYYFFCAYYIENPTEEEKKLLDENNWNTTIPVKIEGEIITDPDEAQRYRATSIVVLEEATYIAPPSPRLWNEIHGPWEEISNDMIYEIRQIAVDPNDAEKIYVVVQYKKWGWPGGYWPNSEDIFKLSDGKWEKITNGLPFQGINAIAVALSDPDVMYVGGEGRGVYKSVNGGASWTSLRGPEVGLKTNPRIFSLAVDPIDPSTVYVGTESGAWRKKDGEEWEQITGNVVPKIETNPYETGVVYASSIVKYPEDIYRSGGVLKSEDSGYSWKQKWTKGIANDIEIAKTGKVYVATGSYLTKFVLPGSTMEAQGEIGPLPVLADGILVYDGSDWEESANWHNAGGKEGKNPLPDATPYSVSVHPDFPNMVFAAFPREGIEYSPNFGNDWFPLGLAGKSIGRLLLAPNANSPILYAYGPEDLFKLQLSDTAIIVRRHSAGELRVYDSQGNVTGLVNGQVREEISDSVYYDGTITIFSPADSYRYEFLGTQEESYGLELISLEGGQIVTFIATDIPTTIGAVHQYTIDWDALSGGAEGVTIKIDSDGDGVFEDTFTSDDELAREEFLKETRPSPPVGGEAYPINKVGVLAPWIALLAAIIAGAAIIMRRRRAQN